MNRGLVVHLTSAHHPLDNRIFEKECKTLAAAGYKVILIAPYDKSFEADGVEVMAVRRFKHRLMRFSVTLLQIFWRARRLNANVYHFHDPDLMLVGFALRLSGKKVIYDVHEDYASGIRQKKYLPKFLREPLARAIRLLERQLGSFFEIVIAERYYSRVFPNSTMVLNYPRKFDFKNNDLSFSSDKIHLIYAGNITSDRGAFHHAQLINHDKRIHLHMIGRCAQGLADELFEIVQDKSRLHITGINEHVSFSTIIKKYQSEAWVAGLAIFPDTDHYREKELTKLFEYMAAGIPIVCSNFSAWKSLVEGNQCGICVEPSDISKAVAAIQNLHSDVNLRNRMKSAGKIAYETRYTWESQADTLIKLYEKILARAA